MNDLTGFQRDVLVVIAGLDDPHGLAIKDEIEHYYESEIHHGRLYPNLDELVEAGLIEKGKRISARIAMPSPTEEPNSLKNERSGSVSTFLGHDPASPVSTLPLSFLGTG